jgi:hypothetical protein
MRKVILLAALLLSVAAQAQEGLKYHTPASCKAHGGQWLRPVPGVFETGACMMPERSASTREDLQEQIDDLELRVRHLEERSH